VNDMGQKAESAPAATFHVVTAVWGSEFIRLFLDLCVPNQLSTGNLSALPEGSRYRIFTSPGDRAALAASPALDEVRRTLPVDIVDVDLAVAGSRYGMMTACHRRAITEAAAAQAALMFVGADLVFSENAMAALVRMHAGGARAVLTTGLRLSRESFLAAWHRQGERALPPRDFVRLAMQHLHPATESLFVDGSTTNRTPTSVYWPLRRGGAIDGILVRSLHLHPLMIDPVERTVVPQGTIDGHYLMECCPDPSHFKVITDSDDLAMFELTPAGRTVGNTGGRRGVSMLRLAAVAARCDAYQRSHWERPIRIHASDVDEQWTAVEAESATFVLRLERYRLLGPVLARVYRARKAWGRHLAGYARTVRRTAKHEGRAMGRAVRKSVRRQANDARAMSKAFQPQWTFKRIARSTKLVYHRVAKAGKLGLKRMRRRTRLFRAAC
jgi:hypothetical protein